MLWKATDYSPNISILTFYLLLPGIILQPGFINSNGYRNIWEVIKDDPAYKRLILTHHKNLNKGDFLIDDRDKNGAKDFEGEHIWFGKPEFPDWKTVVDYLLKLK